MARFYVADVVDSNGGVVIQGDTAVTRVTIKDSFVDMRPGRRVLLSDLDQGGNQYVAVRNVFSGPVPFPPSFSPQDPVLTTIPTLRPTSTFTAAWAKTIRYDLSYYDDVIPGITGTAYSTLVTRPRDFREMLPYGAINALPEALRSNVPSFTNLVVGGDYAHPLRIRARNLGDPVTFRYVGFPTRSRFQGIRANAIWSDPLLVDYGLNGMLPPDAQYSLTLIAIVFDSLDGRSGIANVPVNIAPTGPLASADQPIVESAIASAFFGYDPPVAGSQVVYVGASMEDLLSQRLSTPYNDVTNYLKDRV